MLPTGGTAVHAQGLSTTAFMKAVQIVEYTQDALAVIGEDIVAVARSEDLPAHGRAITIRTGS